MNQQNIYDLRNFAKWLSSNFGFRMPEESKINDPRYHLWKIDPPPKSPLSKDPQQQQNGIPPSPPDSNDSFDDAFSKDDLVGHSPWEPQTSDAVPLNTCSLSDTTPKILDAEASTPTAFPIVASPTTSKKSPLESSTQKILDADATTSTAFPIESPASPTTSICHSLIISGSESDTNSWDKLSVNSDFGENRASSFFVDSNLQETQNDKDEMQEVTIQSPAWPCINLSSNEEKSSTSFSPERDCENLDADVQENVDGFETLLPTESSVINLPPDDTHSNNLLINPNQQEVGNQSDQQQETSSSVYGINSLAFGPNKGQNTGSNLPGQSGSSNLFWNKLNVYPKNLDSDFQENVDGFETLLPSESSVINLPPNDTHSDDLLINPNHQKVGNQRYEQETYGINSLAFRLNQVQDTGTKSPEQSGSSNSFWIKPNASYFSHDVRDPAPVQVKEKLLASRDQGVPYREIFVNAIPVPAVPAINSDTDSKKRGEKEKEASAIPEDFQFLQSIYENASEFQPRPRKEVPYFIDIDNSEDEDNNDSGWEKLKNLKDDAERKAHAQEVFGNKVQSNPGRNMTYHGYRRYLYAKCTGIALPREPRYRYIDQEKVIIEDGLFKDLSHNERNSYYTTSQISRKRKERDGDEDQHRGPAAKKARLDFQDFQKKALTEYFNQKKDWVSPNDLEILIKHFKASIEESRTFFKYYAPTSLSYEEKIEMSDRLFRNAEIQEQIFGKYAENYGMNEEINCRMCRKWHQF